MALTEASELTLADQLRDRAATFRTWADDLLALAGRFDDAAMEAEVAELGPLGEVAAANYAAAQGFEPETVAVADLRVRDVIRLTKAHGAFTDTVTVAAVDAEARNMATLPPVPRARPVALRERSGDLDIGWYPPERHVQLVWRPYPLADDRPNDLDLALERRHEAENGGL